MPQPNFSKPLISIIISTFNCASQLERLLKSIEKQHHPAHEIIIVDNFSTDKTISVARQYTKMVFCYGNERSQQRNYGASCARGEYLLFLDSDMELVAESLSVYTNICQKQRLDALIIPEIVPGNGFWNKCRNLEKQLLQKNPSFCAVRLIKKILFCRIGGYKTQLIAGEDFELDDRLREYGAKIEVAPIPLRHYETNNIIKICQKKYYYGQHLWNYQKLNKQNFRTRFNPFRPEYKLLFPQIFSTPQLVAGLIILKILEYSCGLLGWVRAKF